MVDSRCGFEIKSGNFPMVPDKGSPGCLSGVICFKAP